MPSLFLKNPGSEQNQTTASDLPFDDIFAPQTVLLSKVFDDVIAYIVCGLGPPRIKNPGYAYGLEGLSAQSPLSQVSYKL